MERVRLDDVRKLCGSLGKVRPFIIAEDWTPGAQADIDDLGARLPVEPPPVQLSLF